MTFLDKLPRPFFVLAPMDDVTDTVFRQILADYAPPDLYFTEFVNVDGLQSPGRKHLLPKLKFTTKEKPIVAQLWGLNPENFYKTTKELIEMGFDGIDLNFGCPVKTVIKNGACAAMIKDKVRAGGIIDATKQVAKNFPVSVKTRLGFNEIDLSWHEFLLSKKLSMLTIHGRTAKELSKSPVRWEAVNEVRKMRDKLSPSTLFIGNGDIMARGEGINLAKNYHLDGVMVGRGIFNDPFVFAKRSPWPTWTKQQKISLYQKHIKLFAKTWPNGERKFETLRKFCKVYLNGFEGASELRTKFMLTQSLDEAMALLAKYL